MGANPSLPTALPSAEGKEETHPSEHAHAGDTLPIGAALRYDRMQIRTFQASVRAHGFVPRDDTRRGESNAWTIADSIHLSKQSR